MRRGFGCFLINSGQKISFQRNRRIFYTILLLFRGGSRFVYRSIPPRFFVKSCGRSAKAGAPTRCNMRAFFPERKIPRKKLAGVGETPFSDRDPLDSGAQAPAEPPRRRKKRCFLPPSDILSFSPPPHFAANKNVFWVFCDTLLFDFIAHNFSRSIFFKLRCRS